MILDSAKICFQSRPRGLCGKSRYRQTPTQTPESKNHWTNRSITGLKKTQCRTAAVWTRLENAVSLVPAAFCSHVLDCRACGGFSCFLLYGSVIVLYFLSMILKNIPDSSVRNELATLCTGSHMFMCNHFQAFETTLSHLIFLVQTKLKNG